jgi:hypothetical protein
MKSLFLGRFLSFSRNIVLLLVAGGAVSARAQNWRMLSPGTFPPPRGYLAMTYDGASNVVIVFGGFDGTGYLNDTWLFDGNAWKKVTTPTAPSRRANAQMAYDSISEKVVLFGGYNGRRWLGDTWVWDGATLTWSPANAANSPPGVTGPMLFNDPNGRVDKFGGFDGNRYDGTFWRWTGRNWRQLHPPMVPYARSSAAVALNPARNQVVLFGGLADVNPFNTWTYDGTTWTMEAVNRQPPLVYSGSAAYESTLNSIILFGGGTGGTDQNSTWFWTGLRWKQLFPMHSPTPREGAGMVYDATLNRIILFGGQNGNVLLNDTWEFVP